MGLHARYPHSISQVESGNGSILLGKVPFIHGFISSIYL